MTMSLAPFTVLIVAATEFELAGLRERFGAGDVPFDYLATGVGPVATAFALTERLLASPVHLVVNVGVAGALDPDIEFDAVYDVTTDHFGDLGAEDADGSHLSVFDLGLADPNTAPFSGGRLRSSSVTGVDADAPHAALVAQFLEVAARFFPVADDRLTGTTVSRAHGTAASIAAFRAGNSAQIESMEGAAVFYCARRLGIPCVQYRSISSVVEPRNREAWDIPGALHALNVGVTAILSAFLREAQDALAVAPPRDR